MAWSLKIKEAQRSVGEHNEWAIPERNGNPMKEKNEDIKMSRYLFWTAKVMLGAWLLAGMASGICSAESIIWAPPALSALIDEGLSHNQSIKALEKQIEALKDQISVAGALPDPKVGFSVLNLPVDSFAFDRQPMTQKQFAIDQQIPWLSKLDLKSKAVALTVSQKMAELEASRLALARKIAQAYYDLGYTAQSQNVNAQLIKLVTGIRQNVESRYGVGEGLQQDVFQADVALTQLGDEKLMLENKRRTIEDRLNELLNRDGYTRIAPPAGAPIPPLDLSSSELDKAVISDNPGLAAQRARIARAETLIQLARKGYYPDFDVKLAYGQRDRLDTGQDSPDFFSASVMMSVPIWYHRKQDKALSSARLAHQAARDAYRNLVLSLPHQADALAAQMTDATARYRLYANQLIPQARQWDRSATQGYQVGKVNFNTMIAARTRVLKSELKAEWYRFTYFKKRARLEALIGKPLGAAAQKENLKNKPDQPKQ
jgi:outer membrane protein TolC